MINKFDRYIFFRLTVVTLSVLALLIFIFIIIDFSENSDDFSDRGATMSEIWLDYYLNYIPEMIRLVTPVAVFVAVLLITGQMSLRSELIALKSAGISMYRFMAPYMVFAILVTGTLSYMDGYVVPPTNAERIAFERQYLMDRSDRVERNRIFRQDAPERFFMVNYYAVDEKTAYRVNVYQYDDGKLTHSIRMNRMEWNDEDETWTMVNGKIRTFNDNGYETDGFTRRDTTFNLLPRDFGRRSSDIYQLTYPEIQSYIASLERSGAGGINTPRVQYYGKLFYPIAVLVVTLIGFSVASVKRKGGAGVHIAAGLGVSFLYLAIMKIVEPFGYAGTIDPMYAALLPHIMFGIVALFLLFTAKK